MTQTCGGTIKLADTPHAAASQLQGENLVPFTIDKQTLFLQTARNLFQ